MSGLLPIFPGQRERWSQPRPEPVLLDMPGWKKTVTEPDDTFPNQRWVFFERGEARVELMRYWDLARNPGYPMTVASQRDVVVAGRATKLIETSLFDGFAKRVLLFFLQGKGYDVEYTVRVKLDGYEDVDDVASRIVVAW